MNIRATNAMAAKQSGAALLVAMVLVFILSVLGIASMRDATLEGHLASNSVQKEISFQSAESATDIVLAIEDANHEKAIEGTICTDTPTNFTMSELSEDGKQQTTVELEYGGQSLPTGWSLGGPIGGRRFVVTGESSLIGASTSTRISQGVVAIGAVEAGVDC